MVAPTGRVALVTGGGSGIGAAICRRLSLDGAHVVVADLDPEVAEATATGIRADGGRASARAVDLSDLDAASTLGPDVAADLGRLDVIVSNAGISGRGSRIADNDVDDLQRQLHFNTVMPYVLCAGSIPALRASGNGHVVVISSIATQTFESRASTYTIAKCGLEAFARLLAHEEARHGIRTSIIAPGLVDTPMSRAVAARSFGSEDLEQLRVKMGLDRVLLPSDIADAVAGCLDEQSGRASGERLSIT